MTTLTDTSGPTAQAFFDALRDDVAVMGIVNVTPDSFSGDGIDRDAARTITQARAMAAAGAAIIDIGAESTRPGSTPVSSEDELDRLGPVLRAAVSSLDVPVSIDTQKATVARAAIASGVDVVNDIWGLQGDPGMAALIAEAGAGAILMHNRRSADESIDIVADVHRFFERSLTIADRAGIDKSLIALDPGIGFGKTMGQNLVILNRLEQFLQFGCPLLVGVSRKRFIGATLGAEVEDRLFGTLAVNLDAYRKGARIFRVHDVAEHVQAFTMTKAIEAERYD
ncbi:MAG: dihydropteroate synthase [Pseudomonadota bacterium]